MNNVMNTITVDHYIEIVAAAVEGMCSNPASGNRGRSCGAPRSPGLLSVNTLEKLLLVDQDAPADFDERLGESVGVGVEAQVPQPSRAGPRMRPFGDGVQVPTGGRSLPVLGRSRLCCHLNALAGW